MRLKPAVFLDRDGVINVDSYEYVKNWDEFVFRPDALASLRRLREGNLEVYIITNQAGIGRGLFTHADLRDILLRLQLQVRRAGGMIHGIEYCCHTPDAACSCRKPGIGSLLKAATKHGLDLPRSVFVGDSHGDVNAAHSAGCTSIFVTTRAELPPPSQPSPPPTTDPPPDPADAIERDTIHARQKLGDALAVRKPGRCDFAAREAFGSMLVDFYCHHDAVAIMVDATRSAGLSDQARAREQYLRTLGVRVFRFTARRVLDDTTAVVDEIEDAVSGILPLSSARLTAEVRDIRALNHTAVLEQLDRCLLPPQYIVPSLAQAVDTILRLPEFARRRRVRRVWV